MSFYEQSPSVRREPVEERNMFIVFEERPDSIFITDTYKREFMETFTRSEYNNRWATGPKRQ